MGKNKMNTKVDFENPYHVPNEEEVITVKKVFNAKNKDGKELKGKYHNITPQNPFVVATFLWNDPKAKHKGRYEFTAAHVNRLAKGFRDHLMLPHEFVCITDMPEGIDSRYVRIVPMWDDLRDMGRCFARLRTYDEGMKEILGPRFAIIDLDMVIPPSVSTSDGEVPNDLISLFDRPEALIGYKDSKNPGRNPANHSAPKLPTYSGALRIQTAGEAQRVWRSIRAVESVKFNRSGFIPDFVGSDQCWQSMLLEGQYPRLSSEDGIYDYWEIESLGDELPDGCRMIMVNGMRRDASMPEFYEKHSWLKGWWSDAYTWDGTKEIKVINQ